MKTLHTDASASGTTHELVLVGEHATADEQAFGVLAADLVDRMLGEYAIERARIDELAALIRGGLDTAIGYFIEGNAGGEELHRRLYVDRLFRVPRAVKALDAAFWARALAMTDVLELMPQARRQRWQAQLNAWRKGTPRPEDDLPPFDEPTVRETLMHLLAQRANFLAERVDGLFSALSRGHATNQRSRFGTRMILAQVVNERGIVQGEKAGYLHDLRGVVAKFMNQPEPTHNETAEVIEHGRGRPGEWIAIDGNTLRLRVYKAGTVHVDLHLALVQRLNAVLASVNPLALAAEPASRRRAPSAPFPPLLRPLSFPVRFLLGQASATGSHGVRLSVLFDKDRSSLDEAGQALQMIGGITRGVHAYEFPYAPRVVLDEIAVTGSVPPSIVDRYLATPPDLALDAVALAAISDADRCLVPCAADGALACLLPADQTVCVEAADLYCAALRRLGFQVEQREFLEWAVNQPTAYTRILMHPPRRGWLAPLVAAAPLLMPGGRLVAILPDSAQREQWPTYWPAAAAPGAARTAGCSRAPMRRWCCCAPRAKLSEPASSRAPMSSARAAWPRHRHRWAYPSAVADRADARNASPTASAGTSSGASHRAQALRSRAGGWSAIVRLPDCGRRPGHRQSAAPPVPSAGGVTYAGSCWVTALRMLSRPSTPLM